MTREELTDVAIGSLILVCIALPGYFVSIFTVDGCMGRRGVQFMGFAASTVVFLTLGAAYKPLVAVPGAFIFLYGLTYFFANWGANTSTFLMPAESFPTRARATAHGISAATGKLGATLGSYGLPYLLVMYGTDADSKARGLVVIMYVCAGVCALGVVWTLLTVETRGLVFETMDAHHETSSVTGGAPSCDDAASDDASGIVAAAAALERPTRGGPPRPPSTAPPPPPSMAPPSPPAVVTMPDTTATAPPSPPV